MSTCLYLVCLDHTPPLRAASESGQHLSDLPQIRADIAARDSHLAVVAASEWGDVPDLGPFRTATVNFLVAHPHCHIGIRDEYGDEHPLVDVASLTDPAPPDHPGLTIEQIGGACPTQATGRYTATASPFYFRARGGRWTLEVGKPEWPTDYCDWPVGPCELVAAGDDPTGGFMDRGTVVAILAANVPAPTLTAEQLDALDYWAVVVDSHHRLWCKTDSPPGRWVDIGRAGSRGGSGWSCYSSERLTVRGVRHLAVTP